MSDIIKTEQLELLELNRRMNSNMEKQLQLIEERTVVIREQTEADIKLTRIKEQEVNELAIKNKIENDRNIAITTLIAMLKELVGAQKTILSHHLPEQSRKLDWIIDFEKIMLRNIIRSGGSDSELDRLTEILKSFGHGQEVHFGIGTTIHGNMMAKDVNIAENGATLANKGSTVK